MSTSNIVVVFAVYTYCCVVFATPLSICSVTSDRSVDSRSPAQPVSQLQT